MQKLLLTQGDYNYTQKQKGTKTVPMGYYCYKWYPFFKGALFSLINSITTGIGVPFGLYEMKPNHTRATPVHEGVAHTSVQNKD